MRKLATTLIILLTALTCLAMDPVTLWRGEMMSLGGHVATTPYSIPTNGLIGRWTFDDTWTDSVSNYVITPTGAIITNASKFGTGAAYLDGSNDRFDCTNFPTYPNVSGNTYSVSFWIAGNSDMDSDVNPVAFSWLTGSYGDSLYMSVSGNGGLQYKTQTSITNQWRAWNDANVWRHFVVTWTNRNTTPHMFSDYYKDGILITLTNPVVTSVPIRAFRFGNRNDDNANTWLSARIDDLLFYDRQLTSNEVYEMWNNQK